jgi:pyruvate formate lyase activating enzyme
MQPPRLIARFQTARAGGVCRCELCPRHCVIQDGEAGFCGHRANDGGELIAARYGLIAAAALDPIEKKPLHHFHPGASIFSIGANGCNLSCKYCQNWHLSEGRAAEEYAPPETIVARAGERGSLGLAFTYNEPTVWFEYILACAPLLRARGLKTVLVTNGYLEPGPWDELCRCVDAMNVDVKGDDAFYRRLTGGRLAPVRRNVEAAWRAGVRVETTNLLVTDANDSEAQLAELVEWQAGVSPDLPLHLSRYYPNREWDAPPTPAARLERAAEIARAKLRYVYVGNINIPGAADTQCPACGAAAVRRRGYAVDRAGLTADGRCAICGAALPLEP